MSKSEENVDKSDSISMHDFLDFLKITCQLNESINATIDKTHKKVDYDQLAKNELIHSILDKSNASNPNPIASCEKGEPTASIDKKGTYRIDFLFCCFFVIFLLEKLGATNKRRSSRKSKDETKPSLDPSLSEKLEEVINEGILDSVLPFLCTSSNTAGMTSVIHTCPTKSKASASTINIGTNVLNKPDVPSHKTQSETVITTKKSDTHTTGPSKLRRKSVFPTNSHAE